MSLQLKKVHSKKELKAFIKFPSKLYEGNTHYVPPLIEFEMSTLLKEKNPAFDHAKACYWVVEEDSKIVGRIAAIVLKPEIQDKGLARFGWIDFVDDKEVSKLLLDTAREWTQQKGATFIHGPMGFTDFDFEGALTEGFDERATQATLYNYPYYIDHFQSWGLVPSATWVELRGKVPNEIPKRIIRSSSIVRNRFKVYVKEFKKAKDVLKYAPGMFDVLNEAYSHLYGYYPLTQKQIDYYVEQYFRFIRKEFVCIVVNDHDEVVGFALSLPSLSKAFQKAKGHLYPFGFIHVLKSFYFEKLVDMFLIGVKPDYQKMGVNALIFENLCRTYIRNGIKYVASGPMLEDNRNILNTWNDLSLDLGKIKRSCFMKQF